uniref:BZIP domain-containing protein n=1 Tax=Anopheles dirus TaxID=7168 RepID=A0A182NUN1_9DIPT
MEGAFAGRDDFDLSLEDEYLSPAMFDSVQLCSEFGEFVPNDLLPQPQQTTWNTVNEFALDPQSSGNYGEIINPDDFLNDVPCDSSLSPSSRDTPSPSDSQKSFESVPSSGGFDGCHVVPMHLDSPPISPQTPTNPMDVSTSGVKPFGQLRRVKIVPKKSIPSSTVGKTITKKTIVLSAKDYHALIANMQAQPSNNTIIVKATPTNMPPVNVATVQRMHTIAPAHTPTPDKSVVLPKPTACIPDKRTEPVCEVKSPVAIKEEPPVNTLTVPMMLATGTALTEQTIDERLLKKHQRMIKNRQSAFESRQKKKEYVTSLEERLEQLSKENQRLRRENSNLLERLKVRCTCAANSLLVGQSSLKPVSPTARKNTAIVLAMVFMVSLNFYPIGNLLTNTDHVELDRMSNDVMEYHSRGLLWTNNSTDASVGRERSNAYRLNLTALDELTKQETVEAFPVTSECPFYVNQTENIRLASELRRWIGENGYKNLTDGSGQADVSIDTFDKMFRLKDTLDSMYRHMKDISMQMKTYERRQKLASGNGKKLSRNHRHGPATQRPSSPNEVVTFRKRTPSQHELDLYYPRVHVKYAEFFEEIGRRDDTFYLVSFSAEHLLLPALAYNKTNRPRMSLMLPTVTPGTPTGANGTDKITLMQIDCEVMNTSMIQIREKTIPGDLRPTAGHGSEPTKGAGGGQRSEQKGNADYESRNATANRTTSARGTRGTGPLPAGNRLARTNFSSTTHPATDTAEDLHQKRDSVPTRPFFVERMNEHLKSEHHVN